MTVPLTAIPMDGVANISSFSAVATLPASSNSAPVCACEAEWPTRRGLQRYRFTVGTGGNLDAFYLTTSPVPLSQNSGEPVVQNFSAADLLNTPQRAPSCPGLTALPVAAGTSFDLDLDMTGVGAVQFWAGSIAGTTLEISAACSELVPT